MATLVDSLPLAGQEAAVLATGVRQAATLGCDLICANQLPSTLQQASRQTGWLPGPSNFLLATSKTLTDAMNDTTSYISRRDGDGLASLFTDEE